MINQFYASSFLWKDLLLTGMKEDLWQWDWTTLSTLKHPDQTARAQVIAKSEGVWAANSLISSLNLLSSELGDPVTAKSFVKDGDLVKPGDIVSEWSGSARSVLALERPFLNLAAYACGIATKTHDLVSKVEKAWEKTAKKSKQTVSPKVTCTRKTLPGYRDLAIYSVLVGGGWSHRLGLSNGVLLKENHIVVAGGIPHAVEKARKFSPHGMKIEIEVTSLAELDQAIQARADIIMFDNFVPEQVIRGIEIVNRDAPQTVIEVSGGLNETNIESYVIEGVHILSTGSITHSVKSTDLSLLVRY